MIDRWIKLSIAAITLVLGAYVINFYSAEISKNPESWGQIGDYLGGVLNPILSFISLVLIVKSLNLQRESNLALKMELEQSRQGEKLRSFENKFFNMIEVQSSNFQKFYVDFPGDIADTRLNGPIAVIAMENEIERLRQLQAPQNEIAAFICSCDSEDQIFGAVRTFFTCAKYVMDHLSDAKGFSQEERLEYLKTLINFTEFPLVRLNMIAIKFLDYEASRYLKSCGDFKEVLQSLELDYDAY
ncbi:hypothetical protein ACQHIH_00015 [Xanthomonas sontii]|uniref:hypothetical protein n=1 Tax=Xanthomonas sontii TaxID=2650745 RepID=UPI003F852AB8